ncbi:MAG: hypothetical protein P0S94_02960 [Simkaniaceae bacterium]|nr:hypothetical protein [Simkaniaceae bacterium]
MTIYSNQSLDNHILYVSNETVYCENRDDSIIGRLFRALYSIIQWRDYSIDSILKQKEITPLIEKQAKKCGLEASTLKLLQSDNQESIEPLLKATHNLALSKFAQTSGAKYYDQELLDALITYTYKVKLVDKVSLMTQLNVDLDDIPDDYQRLTLDQMRTIESMENARSAVEILKARGAEIQSFETQVDRAEAFSQKVRKKANEELQEDGVSIACYDFDTTNALYKKNNKIQYAFWAFFRSNVEHVSLLYSHDGEMKETHIAGNPVARFRKEVMPLSSYAFSRISINFERALEGQIDKLKDVYGDEDVITKVKELYTSILSQQIEEVDEYPGLSSGFISRLCACFKPRIIARGSWASQLQFSGNVALCSEFVVKAMLRAFDTLNTQYKKGASEKGMSDVADLFPPVSNWTRMSTVLPGTIAAKVYDPRYTHHEAPEIISRLFETQKTWLCLPI